MDENRSKILRIRGEMIKTAREEKGMEQKELAYRLGYSDASTLNKIEIGFRRRCYFRRYNDRYKA